MKPIGYCKDNKTLERCFEFLEEWVKTEQKRGRRLCRVQTGSLEPTDARIDQQARGKVKTPLAA
jgi:hypothetical protein